MLTIRIDAWQTPAPEPSFTFKQRNFRLNFPCIFLASYFIQNMFSLYGFGDYMSYQYNCIFSRLLISLKANLKHSLLSEFLSPLLSNVKSMSLSRTIRKMNLRGSILVSEMIYKFQVLNSKATENYGNNCLFFYFEFVFIKMADSAYIKEIVLNNEQ